MATDTEHPIAPPNGAVTGTRDAPDSPFLTQAADAAPTGARSTRRERASGWREFIALVREIAQARRRG